MWIRQFVLQNGILNNESGALIISITEGSKFSDMKILYLHFNSDLSLCCANYVNFSLYIYVYKIKAVYCALCRKILLLKRLILVDAKTAFKNTDNFINYFFKIINTGILFDFTFNYVFFNFNVLQTKLSLL